MLGRMPPYPVLSLPVLFGIAGGAGMIVGTTGLLYLKARSDRIPASRAMMASDYAFMVLLDLVAISGMLLLLLRATGVMGSLLAVHLGLVLAFFLTAPYGKFVHWVYRYAALVKNATEISQGR
jgi:citrate/tricarballylate utilization protein